MKITRMIRERGDEDYRDYKKALSKAKSYTAKAHQAIEELCELTEDMEDEFGERDDYEDEEESKMKMRMRKRGY